jgi:hypothetical protein
MPRIGMAWRHVTMGTHNSWLPGEPRGFRSKDHKIHSSGDYKNSPPEWEHAGLWEYSKRISGEPLIIPKNLREPIGRAILADQKRGLLVLAVAVGGMHAHVQVELPDDKAKMRQIVGKAKTAACYAVKAQMPGKIWARHGGYKRIKDIAHQRQVHGYIYRQKDAWVWSYRLGSRYNDEVS